MNTYQHRRRFGVLVAFNVRVCVVGWFSREREERREGVRE